MKTMKKKMKNTQKIDNDEIALKFIVVIVFKVSLW